MQAPNLSSDKSRSAAASGFGNDPSLIETILTYAAKHRFSRNDEIPIKDTETPTLYYVSKGSIEVYQTVGDTKIVVALIGAGNFFGEIGFFDGVSRVRNISVTADSEICMITLPIIERIQEEQPKLYAAFITFLTRTICAKFRRILEENEPLTGYAASLSTGRHSYHETTAIPSSFLAAPAWKAVHSIVEQSKSDFFNLSYRLQNDPEPTTNQEIRNELFSLLDKFNNVLIDLNLPKYKQEEEDFIWGYVFKEFFPYFMRSRFAERAYYKPKGYAGDFLMMEMIYRNRPAGDGKLGILVDDWCLNTAAAKAIRGRRALLQRQLDGLSMKMMRRTGYTSPLRIMNLACGANRELFDFISGCDYSEHIEALCVDIDKEALEYTNHKVNTFRHHAAIRLMKENLVKWSLGKINHEIPLQDIIYSSGLTDYLDARLFVALVNRCYEHLKPGGVLMIGNFSPKNPNRAVMDHILYWKLIHRDDTELRNLFLQTAFGQNVQIISEDQGVNLFAVATRP